MSRSQHGLSRTPEYRCRAAILHRCLNPRAKAYPRYGGRGVWVDPRWVESLEAFIEDVGLRPGPSFTLDRRDNDGPYTKDNVRWVTRKVQNDNRSCTKTLTAFGQTKPLADWCIELGLKYTTVRERIRRHGWDSERALTRRPEDANRLRIRNEKGQYA